LQQPVCEWVVDWTAVGSVVAVLSLLATIWALWFQVKSLRRSVESTTYQEIIRMFNDFSCHIIDHPKLEKLVFGEEELPASDVTAEDRTKANWIIGVRFVWFEGIVIQKKVYNSIREDIYRHWLEILKRELETKSMEAYWRKHGSQFHPELQAEIRRIRPAPEAQA
jgi:hypothetical protein